MLNGKIILYFIINGNEMALIVFRSIFRNTINAIKIVTKDSNNKVTNHKEYISALESFLMKSNSRLELLLSDMIRRNQNVVTFSIC